MNRLLTLSLAGLILLLSARPAAAQGYGPGMRPAYDPYRPILPSDPAADRMRLLWPPSPPQPPPVALVPPVPPLIPPVPPVVPPGPWSWLYPMATPYSPPYASPYSAYPPSDPYSSTNPYSTPTNPSSTPTNPYSASTNPYSTSASSSAAAPETRAVIKIQIPTTVSEVWVDGQKLPDRFNNEHTFITPILAPDRDYTYRVKAHFVRRGDNVTETRTVTVRANETATIDFAQARGKTGVR